MPISKNDRWRYMDMDRNVHFSYSRVIVLIVWYAYVFIGPFVLIFLYARRLYRRYYSPPAKN